MDSKSFGGTARHVTSLGMGTYYDFPWIIMSRLGVVAGAEAKVAALKAGLEGGISLIDTAEVYNSEPLVAKAIEGLPREDLFIATKVTFTHLGHDALVRSLERSLKRLKLGYVDLYQVHQPSPFVHIKETMSAMEEMVDRGLIRYIGVSNFSVKQTVEANGALKKYRLVDPNALPSCRQADGEGDTALLQKGEHGASSLLPAGPWETDFEQGVVEHRAEVRKDCYPGGPQLVALPR